MRFRRASRLQASTRAARTGCSVLGRGRRSGAGRRLEGHERRAIWTRRRWRRYSRRWRGSRRSGSGSRRGPPRRRQRLRLRRLPPHQRRPPQPPAATAEQENLFWQSTANSTNPAEFEAYLAQFPNGVFRALAEARLAALRAPASESPAAVGRPAGGVGSPATGSRVFGGGGASFGGAAGVDAPRRPADVFRDCAECPEIVVLPGGRLALGRYEVTGRGSIAHS